MLSLQTLRPSTLKTSYLKHLNYQRLKFWHSNLKPQTLDAQTFNLKHLELVP
jgi:hypothetical protein